MPFLTLAIRFSIASFFAFALCAFFLGDPAHLIAQGAPVQGEDREAKGPPDPCNQALRPTGKATGLHRRCEGTGGGGGAAKGDFNGDGFADLAVGVPFEDQDGINAVGGVNIIYGSAAGLTASADQFLDPTTFGYNYASNDHFGWALAAGDFDNDGFSDLAIGIPDRDIFGVADAGAVVVIEGSGAGLDPSTGRTLPLPTTGSAGEALVWADFNGDGFGDLAVGLPGATVQIKHFFAFGIFICVDDPRTGAGEVEVLYGGRNGLSTTNLQRFHQGSIAGDFCNSPSSRLVGDFPFTDDRFGSSLAAGDFNADSRADLVIGVPMEDLPSADDAGLVHLVPGGVNGLKGASTQLLSQSTAGIGGGAEAGDQFGRALAVGDFNADLRDDLAIGVPFEDLLSNRAADAGVVHVVFGSFDAAELVTTIDSMFISQAALSGVAVEAGDRFGWALTVGRFDSDFREDLVIGVPGEAIGSIAKAGIVQVLYGSSAGPSLTRVQTWHQNRTGIPDAAESGDQFGYAVSAWDYGHDSRSDLAIGVPFEDISSLADVGEVIVIFGSADGLSATVNAAQLWHQNTSGINDVSQAGDRFGNALY